MTAIYHTVIYGIIININGGDYWEFVSKQDLVWTPARLWHGIYESAIDHQINSDVRAGLQPRSRLCLVTDCRKKKNEKKSLLSKVLAWSQIWKINEGWIKLEKNKERKMSARTETEQGLCVCVCVCLTTWCTQTHSVYRYAKSALLSICLDRLALMCTHTRWARIEVNPSSATEVSTHPPQK